MPNTILPDDGWWTSFTQSATYHITTRAIRKQIDRRRVYLYLLLTSVASVMTYNCVCIRRVVRCRAVLSCLLLDLRVVVISHVCPYSFQLNKQLDATTSLLSTHIDGVLSPNIAFRKKKREETKKQRRKVFKTLYEGTAGVQLQKKRNRVVLITIEISIESNYTCNRKKRQFKSYAGSLSSYSRSPLYPSTRGRVSRTLLIVVEENF